MTKTATINARINPATKKAAEAIFAKLGLSTTDAITLFLNQVELHKGLPFEVKIPNKQTRKAIEELRTNKKLKTYKSTSEMFADLLK
jgi:DNA-damage-inducible protein J